MKRLCMLLMFLLAMTIGNYRVFAQSVTITLMPGWNWISVPLMDTLDFQTALGSFTPVAGDIIKSQWGNASYMNGQWRGPISQFYPGYGYMYKSNRTMPVFLTFTAQQPNPQGNDHEYVDLGLPSGNLWATCNIGAQTPEDYGDYFAWGETLPKDTYSWSSYQYCNGSISTITKYCNDSEYGYNGFTDTLTTLQPIDDAAAVYWGTDWHMPTKEEWEELYTFTTVTWITQNGVNGRLFTASNGNSIFLPATGCFSGANHIDAGSCGYYWSSSLYTDNPSRAWRLSFDSGGLNMSGITRWYGYAVRAVHSVAQNTSFIINATANPAEGGEVSGGGNYQQGDECTLTATANDGYFFSNWTENDEVVSTDVTYTFTVNADRTLIANFTNSSGEHTYVDLGLPSGLLWATCNVGANAPEEYGDYFAWGETEPKNYYDWNTYQHCNGNDTSLTKYCNDSNYGYNGFTDNLMALLPEDDAATVNWGSDWRMPTKEEWQELYNNTTSTWTSQNGVNGRLFTASNGNSLFLPAAGCLWDSDLHYLGSSGSYWSRSLFSPSYNAFSFRINSNNCYTGNGGRSNGCSVRPVRSVQSITFYSIDAVSNLSEGGSLVGMGTYEENTVCILTATANQGYIFINWTENGNVVSTNATYTFTVNVDRTLVANFSPIGAINGLFTINSDGDQVFFSQGNLQYKASSNTWRFATNQYDYIGSANGNISNYNLNWIDLFGWGTSGWNNGNTYYHPWDSSWGDSETLYGPPGSYSLTGTYANSDWGVYNPISNGGNISNQWRTLKESEWYYVFNTRSTASGIRYAKARINGVAGVVLLPDNWSLSVYNFSNANNPYSSYGSNTLTVSQWNILEQSGAVFLPAAGYRVGTSVEQVGSYGRYWSSSCWNSGGAQCVEIYDVYISIDGGISRCYGYSVRLVHDVE